MNQSFAGKTAVVTGGASGIGKSVARQLLERGASVVIADVNASGQSLAEQWKSEGYAVEFQRTDIRRIEETDALAALAKEKFGGLDILVNCAGIFPRATLLETTDEIWNNIMDVNLLGTFHTCKSCAAVMIPQGHGVIINIGSMTSYGGSANMFAYSTSKGAVVTMTKNLARSLAKDRIRVNCVNPGWVVTEGEIALQRTQGLPDNWVNTEGSRLPLGKLQTPDDIASAVVYIASDEAYHITGQILDVDGGLGFMAPRK